MDQGWGRTADRSAGRRARAAVLGLSAAGVGLTSAPWTAAAAQQAPQVSLPTAPSAVARPIQLSGGVLLPTEQPGPRPLTLDAAIENALQNNTEILVRTQQEKYVSGQILTVANALLPTLTAVAYTQAQEINLRAQGLNPANIHIPGFNQVINPIVKVNTTSAQMQLTQTLTLPAYFLFRAAQKTEEATHYATLRARGGVAISAGALYLRILADGAEVRNARALLVEDAVVLDHARQSQAAGVGIHLDVLRAQVQLQNEQQELVRAENAEAKDKINLNREMGQAAGQELTLTDRVPFAEAIDAPLAETLDVAYANRKDLRGLTAQLDLAQKTRRAIKYERYPSLGVGGFYGVLGETTGLYHGVFAAQGTLQIPVFQEATFRGQAEVADAQIRGIDQQIAGLRSQIEGEVRASMLDVQSAREVLRVAQSNVVLSQQALDDATLRFTSGIADNLPVVRAQAALVGAQTQVIEAEFQFNYAKLQLARNTGVVETEYRRYLGQ